MFFPTFPVNLPTFICVSLSLLFAINGSYSKQPNNILSKQRGEAELMLQISKLYSYLNYFPPIWFYTGFWHVETAFVCVCVYTQKILCWTEYCLCSKSFQLPPSDVLKEETETFYHIYLKKMHCSVNHRNNIYIILVIYWILKGNQSKLVRSTVWCFHNCLGSEIG